MLILAAVNVQLDIRLFVFGLDYQRRLNIFNGDSIIRTDASFQRSKIAHFYCSVVASLQVIDETSVVVVCIYNTSSRKINNRCIENSLTNKDSET